MQHGVQKDFNIREATFFARRPSDQTDGGRQNNVGPGRQPLSARHCSLAEFFVGPCHWALSLEVSPCCPCAWRGVCPRLCPRSWRVGPRLCGSVHVLIIVLDGSVLVFILVLGGRFLLSSLVWSDPFYRPFEPVLSAEEVALPHRPSLTLVRSFSQSKFVLDYICPAP